MKSYAEFKKELLKDPKFREEYEALEVEFTIVEALIEKRIKEGLSQEELAKKIGTKQSAISRLESGNYNPTIKFLQKIAKGLGLKLKISFS